jgi:hypothetical protein
MYATIADKIGGTGVFREPEQWRFDWRRTYTREQWLDFLPTTGGLTQVPPDTLTELLENVGAAIDSMGGRFTMSSTTLATTAERVGAEERGTV